MEKATLYRNVVPLVLASASSRRRNLLESLGISIKIMPSSVDENTSSCSSPVNLVKKLAEQKAMDVFSRVRDLPVLAADTVVVFNNEILGKPRDCDDAIRILSALSGNTHSVLTGVSLVNPSPFIRIYTWSCETLVSFRNISPEEIEAYVMTGEPMDKAGAYGIQDMASSFVEKVEGSYTNVVGLPLSDTVKLLLRLGIIEVRQ